MGPVSKPNGVGCNGQLNNGNLHKQTRRNSLSRDVCFTVADHDLARYIPGCLYVMVDLLSRSNQVQSTEWSLLPRVFKQICQKWFTPHIDLFATNHKLPLYVSPVPDPNAWDTDALNISWMGLTAYAYPPQGDPKNQTVQLLDHCNSPRKVLGASAALNRDPTSATSVNNSSQTVPQLCVPQQSTTSQPPCLVSRGGQLQEKHFSVEVAERIAAPQRPSTRTVYKSKWAVFEKWCRENSVDFSTPSVKQVSDFFMYLYQDLNRHPSTIDGYRTAIVDTWGPAGHLISQSSDLHRLLSSFSEIIPKVPGISLSGTFLWYSMSSQKHPLSL